MLDQRDRLLEELSKLVQVDAAEQRDGTTSVFIGTGQVLVLGGNAAQVAVTPGNADPLQPQIVIRGIGPDVNVTQFVTGGELGGAARLQSRDARADALGARPDRRRPRRARSMPCTATAWTLDGQLGGNFFAIGAPQSFSGCREYRAPASIAVTITGVAALRADELSADVRRHGVHVAARRQRRRRADDRRRHGR